MPASCEAREMGRVRLRWCGAPLYAAAILFSATLPHSADAQAPTYDLVLRNARIIDGSGKPAYRAEVAIRGDTIVRIAPSITDPAARVIDVGSQVVAPGFIDVHNHGRVGIFRLPTADNLVRQGVTTAIEGPDGSSPVPLAPFLQRLSALQKSINIGTFIGHGSVRERVMGRVNRAASPEELGPDAGPGRAGNEGRRVRAQLGVDLRSRQVCTDLGDRRACEGGRPARRSLSVSHPRRGRPHCRGGAGSHSHRRASRTADADYPSQGGRCSRTGARASTRFA